MLDCRILGPTEVDGEGAALKLGGPLPRPLITALIAMRGQALTDNQLLVAVWGDPMSERAIAALRVHVARLRGVFGADADVLQRGRLGYLLDPRHVRTDRERFTDQLGEAQNLLRDGHPASALQTADTALALWRGDPYADLEDSELVEAERITLLEMHEIILDIRAAALLALGDPVTAAIELDSLVRRTPYREQRWALLVLALYRGSRQAEALAALASVRRMLTEELGVDPGPRLRDLERRVLQQDPELLLPEPAAGSLATPDPAPAPPAARLGLTAGVHAPLTMLNGRDRELDQLEHALAEHRLVMLSGPAGVGKTRLAVEHILRAAVPDGPWLVRLADVPDAEGLQLAVAAAVDVADCAEDPLSSLVAGLGSRSGLLVLDNCEHLTEPVADLVLELLDRCRGLRVLATSRQPLGVDGEQVLLVHPLRVTGRDGAPGPAMELFAARAHAVRPDWAPTSADWQHVRRICTALDGLPLAIELAAARARMLAIAEIADRLEDRFALLGPVPRGSLSPHTTLLAAIEWSVAQLAPTDRDLLSRLWPFEGGFALEAVAAVEPSGSVPIESLSTLVAHSVVTADTTMSSSRYRLLETIRAYCRERDPDRARSAEAHARWVRTLVETATDEFTGPRCGFAMRRLARELPNIRAGIAHDLRVAPERALRAIGQLNWFWLRDGHITEATALVAAALAAAPDADPLDRARALIAQGNLAGVGGAAPRVVDRNYLDAIAITMASDARESRILAGHAHFQRVFNLLAQGQPERALVAAESALRIGFSTGDAWLTTSGRMVLGAAQIHSGEPGPGEKLLDEVGDDAEQAGFHWTAGWAQLHLAQSLANHAELGSTTQRQALALLKRAVDNFEQMAEVTFTLVALLTTSTVLSALGELTTAHQLRAAVHEHLRRMGLRTDVLERHSVIIPTESGAITTSPRDTTPGALLSLRDMTALAFDRAGATPGAG